MDLNFAEKKHLIVCTVVMMAISGMRVAKYVPLSIVRPVSTTIQEKSVQDAKMDIMVKTVYNSAVIHVKTKNVTRMDDACLDVKITIMV